MMRHADSVSVSGQPGTPGASPGQRRLKVCVVQDTTHELAATFLRAHVDHLPARMLVVHGVILPAIDNRPLLSQSLVARASRKALRRATGRPWEWEQTWGYLRAFRRFEPDVVLAQFGACAVRVREACRQASIPLVAHFHGLDATQTRYLQDHAETYPLLFRDAAAIVGVSRAMCRQLIQLGAAPDKVVWSPYGVDCRNFGGATPAANRPIFLATGRFVDKKAPHLTLLAFSRVHQQCPDARLRMIGDGPLLGACQDLARSLGVADVVEFLGTRRPPEIGAAMRESRAFVQHSIRAADGDCEGTPVAIIEAGASGLPTVATRHAGIPDVVLEERTGLLVDEHDVQGMSEQMLRLAQDAEFAGRLGRAARERIETHFSLETSITRLATIIAACSQPQITRPLPAAYTPALASPDR